MILNRTTFPTSVLSVPTLFPKVATRGTAQDTRAPSLTVHGWLTSSGQQDPYLWPAHIVWPAIRDLHIVVFRVFPLHPAMKDRVTQYSLSKANERIEKKCILQNMSNNYPRQIRRNIFRYIHIGKLSDEHVEYKVSWEAHNKKDWIQMIT